MCQGSKLSLLTFPAAPEPEPCQAWDPGDSVGKLDCGSSSSGHCAPHTRQWAWGDDALGTDTGQSQLSWSPEPLLVRPGSGFGTGHEGPSRSLQPLLPWPPGTRASSQQAHSQRVPGPGAAGICGGGWGRAQLILVSRHGAVAASGSHSEGYNSGVLKDSSGGKSLQRYPHQSFV